MKKGGKWQMKNEGIKNNKGNEERKKVEDEK